MDSFSKSDLGRKRTILTQGADWQSAFGTGRVCDCRRKNFEQPLTSSKEFYLIGRAYNEPQVCNHVENLLLQRNFIID